MRTPDDVVNTALAHLARRNPGPSVIDGLSNRVGAAAARVLNRRGTAVMMPQTNARDEVAPQDRGPAVTGPVDVTGRTTSLSFER